MTNQVDAVYENGVFRPLAPVDLPEHQRVTVNLPAQMANSTCDGDPSNTDEPWTEEKNERRCDLIDKDIDGNITDAEAIELKSLQRQAIAYRDRISPLPIEGAAKLHQKLLEKKRAAKG